MMQIKNKIFAMGAAFTAVMGASPASATIYQYTFSTNDVLTVNTTSKSATLKGGIADMTFTSNDLANFTGGALPTAFTAILNSVGGTLSSNGTVGSVVNTNLADLGTGVPKLVFVKSVTGFIIRGVQWTNVKSDISFNITNYAVLPDPTPVPEPAMLGLFGAGALMVMVGRRRRVRFGKAGTGQLALAC